MWLGPHDDPIVLYRPTPRCVGPVFFAWADQWSCGCCGGLLCLTRHTGGTQRCFGPRGAAQATGSSNRWSDSRIWKNGGPLPGNRCRLCDRHSATLTRGVIMATFISLVNFTDQGIRAVKDSPDRFQAFKALGQTLGIEVKAVYWTVGSYDLVLIVEGDEEAAISLLLKVGSLGNTRSQTLRGFSEQEMRKIIGNMP